MPSQITNYQCPACTGPLHYDGKSSRLLCDYCGSSFSVEEIEKLYQEKLDEAAEAGAALNAQQEQTQSEADYEASQTWDGEKEGMKLYHCPSCGAELLMDRTTAASSCPYCANPSVIPAQFEGLLRPDYILPFKITKDEAVQALTKYYNGKPLLPGSFSDRNHIEEIRGVYVPFWLFDGKVSADARYQATRVFTAQQGDELITTTEYYDVRRKGDVAFKRIPADGSRKMPDDLMDSIEPFDYQDLQPFSTAYMPGYVADIYDVDDRETFERASSRGNRTAEQIFDSSVSGYSSITPVQKNFHMKRERTAYALLPVWLLCTQWNGERFIFAMNGQTGKFIGDLPVSKKKYFAYFAGIAAPLAALLALIFFL